MTAIFEMALPSETLSAEEIADISGCSRKNDQIDWLSQNGWVYIRNKAGAPIIGRLYARLKLAGINPASLAAPNQNDWRLDLANVR